jgi:hypothetical protein
VRGKSSCFITTAMIIYTHLMTTVYSSSHFLFVSNQPQNILALRVSHLVMLGPAVGSHCGL